MAEHRIEQLAPLKDAAELVSALRERQVKIIEEGRNFHIEIPRNPQDFSLPDNVDLREDITGAAPGDDIRAHYNFPEGTKRQAWAGWNLASSEVWSAWTGLNGAVAGQDAAQQNLDNLLTLRNNPQQLQVQAAQAETAFHQAEAAVAVAQANLKLIRAGAPPEQIEIMRTNVAQAQAALDALQVQRQKYTLSAPSAGMILDLPVHTGELAQPSRALLTLGDLSTVDLKLYLPETEMGRIKLGQPVEVNTDSFPGETFTGQVIWISDEAEFTPKNVQTKEQRVNTVFAVKVRLANPEQKLKPGMPADAVLVEGSGL
jgi:multidrug resistance efflux pump